MAYRLGLIVPPELPQRLRAVVVRGRRARVGLDRFVELLQGVGEAVLLHPAQPSAVVAAASDFLVAASKDCERISKTCRRLIDQEMAYL